MARREIERSTLVLSLHFSSFIGHFSRSQLGNFQKRKISVDYVTAQLLLFIYAWLLSNCMKLLLSASKGPLRFPSPKKLIFRVWTLLDLCSHRDRVSFLLIRIFFSCFSDFFLFLYILWLFKQGHRILARQKTSFSAKHSTREREGRKAKQ